MSQSESQNLSLGVGISLIASLFFATASSLVWGIQGKFPTIQILFIQNMVSFFCILPLSLRKGWQRLKTNHIELHLMRDLFGITSYYLFFLAIRFLNLVDATTLNYTAPFFVPFIWWIWTKEKAERAIWWSIIIGFIGVSLILNPTKAIFQSGFVFGIFAGITSAVALVAVRLLNLKKEPMSRTLFYYFAIGSIICFFFAWPVWIPPTPQEWLITSSIGIATAIGQILLTIAYRFGAASFLSPLGYAVVIYNALISTFLFEFPLRLPSIIGTLLIIIGGTLTYLLKKRPKTIKEAFETPKPHEKPPL